MTISPRLPAEVPAEATIDIREVLGKVALRKWLVAAVTVLVAGLAGLYSYTREPVYTAKADVLVRPILSSSLDMNQIDQIPMQTELQLVTSTAVAEIAGTLMEPPLDASELVARASVVVPESTQILEISFSDPDPATAQRGAQAFADAYLRFKSRQAIDTITRNVSTLRDRISELDAEIRDLNRQLAQTARGSLEWKTLLDDRGAADTSRLALQNELATIATLNVDPGQVIQPAQRPLSPSSPKHQLNLVLGVFLGLFAGIGLAFASERLGDRVRSPAVLEQGIEAPTLGAIPKASLLRGRSARLVTIEEPRDAAAEAYRTLRTNLLAVCRQSEAKVLLVTSAKMGEGKSTVAANLAAALAQVGRSVVLVSADLRYPRVHAFFGVSNEQGLGQVLAGILPLSEALSETAIADLRVLPSGSVTAIDEPVDLLQSDRMREVIEQCGVADFVVIDGPPILAVADSLVLADLVDGVVFVADAKRGTLDAVAESRRQLGQVGARVLGAVLNRIEGWRGWNVRNAYYYRRSFPYRHLFPRTERDLVVLDGQSRESSETEPATEPAIADPNGGSSAGSAGGDPNEQPRPSDSQAEPEGESVGERPPRRGLRSRRRTKGAAAMSAKTRFHSSEAFSVAQALGIDFGEVPFTLEEFREGLDVELLRGSRDPEKDVGHDDPVAAGRIVLWHLREVPDYYTRDARVEAESEQMDERGREDAPEAKAELGRE